MKTKLIVPALMTLPLLAGCVPLVLGGAAVAGMAATQDREIETSFKDASIAAKMKAGLAKIDFGAVPSVDVSVYGGNVYLVGSVASEDVRRKVLDAAYEVYGVTGVTDIMDVDSSYLRRKYAYDAGLATKVRSRIIGSFKINPNDLSVVVHKGNVYLIGVASKESTREQIVYLAQTTKGVVAVYDYFQVVKNKSAMNPSS
ncbi:MAG: BON domain-containing protein [Pseudomonadota bacterium]|nr:BON domain-containing protein [Pseudomonadota bacterium]